MDNDSAIISSCRDDDNGLDSGSAYVFTKVSENQPPTADFSWTPQTPNTDQHITFDASASHDPEGAITLYEWDWDNDGIYDDADSNPTIMHSWTNSGNYPVTLRVTDDENATDTIAKTVNVTEVALDLTIGDFIGGIGISAMVTNAGNSTATNITWSIDLRGKMILHGSHWTGNISSLLSGDTAKIKTGLILGFGKITIIATATCTEGATDTENRTALLLLFFVVRISEPLS
jgi:PKD repeat protein